MCDALSCLVAAGICCCCFFFFVVIVLWWMKTILQHGRVLLQVITCANQTVAEEMKKLELKKPSFKDRCKSVDECRDSGHLSQEKQAECAKRMHQCECDVVTQLADMQNPPLEEALGGCCFELEEIQKFDEEMAKEAVQFCQDQVHDITANMTKMADCCKGAHPETCRMSDEDVRNIMQPVTNEIISQFEAIHSRSGLKNQQAYALRPGTFGSAHEATIHVALLGSAALFCAFGMVTIIRLRGGGHRPLARRGCQMDEFILAE